MFMQTLLLVRSAAGRQYASGNVRRAGTKPARSTVMQINNQQNQLPLKTQRRSMTRNSQPNDLMKRNLFTTKAALLVCALVAATQIGRAQTVTITDIGPTTPTPGPNDVSQLLDHATTGSPGGLNYYFDAGNPPGSLFTTPSANTGGYVLNSVAIKTQDDSGTSASYSTSQTYVLRIYSVSGTTAALLGTYTSQAFTFTEYDWLQFTGVGLPVSPGGTYATRCIEARRDGRIWAGPMASLRQQCGPSKFHQRVEI
jgi:hypothetical protein